MHKGRDTDMQDDIKGGPAQPSVLKLTNLHAFYGKSHVLHGVSLAVRPCEIVALLGRNVSGRSTTPKAIMGLACSPGPLLWENF